jgi:N-acyl-D-amino-acid deacylase
MLDTIIKNCQIVDGTGKPAYKADVAVLDGRITLIQMNITQEARQIIDGKGFCLAPGFIDPHTHSDMTLMIDGRAESRVYQGVTTEVVGNCGSSPAPLMGASLEEALEEARNFGMETELTWRDMQGYIEKLFQKGSSVNVVPLVGHNTVRGSVLGMEDVQPTPKQQADMERLVADSMHQGARGLSTGLYYPPGYYAKTEEVIGMAHQAAKHGGIYASHIRSESDTLFESVAEAIEIGEKSGARVEISHLKLEGYHNFEGADRLMAMIEEANRRGVQVGCDQYPYIASSTWLGSILPNWAQAGGGKAVGARVKCPATRAALRKDYEQHRLDWENRGGINAWDQVMVTDLRDRPDLVGKTVAQIASERKMDGLDCAFDLIADADGGPGCVFFDQLEDNVRLLMQHPLVAVGSDGASFSPTGPYASTKPHPRSYGTFPRVLGHYVRELKVIQLEEGIRKMTSLTAERFGLTDRGVLRVGAWADLVLFDPATIIDRATFTDPHQFPAGIPYVWVNGVLVIAESSHTGALPGKPL